MGQKRNRPLTPKQDAYLMAFEAYTRAPVHERDQQLVHDLCMAALDDLILEALERQLEDGDA